MPVNPERVLINDAKKQEYMIEGALQLARQLLDD